MGVEIERKFLVIGEGWRAEATRRRTIVQGYLARANGITVRVRIFEDQKAFLTIKTGNHGLSRGEYEYAIPLDDGRDLLELCRPHTIEKTRHDVPAGDGTWEIDEFAGRHKGLVIAEIELGTEQQQIARPEWIGADVTGDERYYNAVLAGY